MQIQNRFKQLFQSNSLGVGQAPGRINIIGEHVDYTGGLAIPAAIDKETIVVFGEGNKDSFEIYSENFGQFLLITRKELEQDQKFSESWKNYVWGAFKLFSKEVDLDRGIRLVIEGHVPMGKGISSSASFELAMLNALNFFYGQKITPLKLCQMAQQIEHQFAGVKCGLLDQFASQFSEKDKLLLVDFKDLSFEKIQVHPHLQKYSWVLVDSLASRELASSGYSQRVAECQRGLELSQVPHFRSLNLDIIHKKVFPHDLLAAKRLEHFVLENERTQLMAKNLVSGDVLKIGELLNQGHQSLSELYEVSLPILDVIQEKGINLQGCVGGRMMGGGFGGCVLFLVEEEHFECFETDMLSFYQNQFSKKGDVLKLRMADGATAHSF